MSVAARSSFAARPSVAGKAAIAVVCGDRVVVGVQNIQEVGTVKFVGPTQFAAGEWVGVELDRPAGKNDGNVKGVAYFESKANHGIFTRHASCSKVAAEGDSSSSTSVPSPASSTAPTASPASSMAPSASPAPDASVAAAASSKASAEAAARERPASSRKRTSSLRGGGQRAVEAQKELASAIEEHDAGRIRASLMVAKSIVGVSGKEIQTAQDILNFEMRKGMFREVEQIRFAVAKLADSVKAASERAAEVEKTAMASKEVIASNSAKASIKAWMSQCVDRIESSVWLSLENRIEEKVQAAVSRALGEQGKTRRVEEKVKPVDTKKPNIVPTEKIEEKVEPVVKPVAKATKESQEAAAASSIQKAMRRFNARATCQGKSMGSAVIVARRRHLAWSQTFDEHASTSGLDKASLTLALREIFPRFSRAQCSAIFDGYTLGTDRSHVDLASFCAICQAAATEDRDVAEFADLCVEDFQALANAEGDTSIDERRDAGRGIQTVPVGTSTLDLEQQQNAAAVKIQRAVRVANARLQSSGNCISKHAIALRRRFKAWCDIYDEALAAGAAGQEAVTGLSAAALFGAMLKIHPQLSQAQATALHVGFVSGTDKPAVSLVGFCGMAEALASGPAYAAEFADISVEEFTAMGGAPTIG